MRRFPWVSQPPLTDGYQCEDALVRKIKRIRGLMSVVITDPCISGFLLWPGAYRVGGFWKQLGIQGVNDPWEYERRHDVMGNCCPVGIPNDSLVMMRRDRIFSWY